MTAGNGDPGEKPQNEGQQPPWGGYEPPPIEQAPAYGGYPSPPPPPPGYGGFPPAGDYVPQYDTQGNVPYGAPPYGAPHPTPPLCPWQPMRTIPRPSASLPSPST